MSKKIFTLTLVALFCFTLTAIAADKVVVIPVKSSSQIYVAGTEITSLPHLISTPGSYFITKNLTCSSGNHGILVNSDNVTINLMGFSLTGSGGTADNHGIFADGKSNVEISNGSIIDFAGAGILVSGGIGSRIIDIRANKNGGSGIENWSNGGLIDRCSASGNGGSGFKSGVGIIVKNCTSTYNTGDGFTGSGAGGMIIGNTSIENGGDGIRAPSGGIVMNNTAWFNTGTGISFYFQENVLVDKNTAYQNGVDIAACPRCTFGTNHTTVPLP